jgi:hypothetical protein
MGFFGICAAGGDFDIRVSCSANADCQAGLICGPTEYCMSLFELQKYHEWPGVICEVADKGDARAYFELPNSDGSPRNDYFRLPFPNNIRLGSGHAATAFPSAGALTTDGDPVAVVSNIISQEMEAWGTTPTVTFRFSQAIDFESLQTAPTDPELGIGHDGRNIFFVNITENAKEYGTEYGYTWSADTRGGKAQCGNWLSIHPGNGAPLGTGGTYAVILLKGLRVSGSVQKFKADNDLAVVLSNTPPPDVAVAEPAWQEYAPLRQFMASKQIAVDELLTAAVFTVHKQPQVIAQARQIVRDLAPATLVSTALCQTGVSSPCADGQPDRQCGSNDAYYEIHGQLKIPVFQSGEAPYLTPSNGGGLNVDGNGNPQGIFYEHVCFSLSVPKGKAMPAAGWPLILYGHDLGEHFRSHIIHGFAGHMANMEVPAAVLGIDGPLHGMRKKSSLDTLALYQNLANIAVLRGVGWQSAIDFLSVTYFAETIDANLGIGAPTRFDASRFAFVGQGRGADAGLIFAAYEPRIGTMVLSGTGALYAEQWAHRSSPFSLVPGFERVLREEAGAGHPLLGLLQHFLSPLDVINFGPLITRRPPEGMPARNLLYIYGSNDTHSAPRGARALADAMGLNIAAPAVETGEGETFSGYESKEAPFEEVDPVTGEKTLIDPAALDRVLDLPISNNHVLGDTKSTVAMSHFEPTEGDGHDVLHKHPGARAQVAHFLSSWFSTGVAEIMAP